MKDKRLAMRNIWLALLLVAASLVTTVLVLTAIGVPQAILRGA